MGDDVSNAAFDADAISDLFLKAKTKGTPFPFAFGLATKPDDCALMVDI